MSDKFFEDFKQGDEIRTRAVTLGEPEIVEFARLYDPQPIHIDKAAAERSTFGGVIASGWHVGSITFRLFLEQSPLGENSMGSPGLDEIRWHLPVRPGDTLSIVITVLEARPSRSKDDRGSVRLRYETFNQKRELVMSFIGVQIIKKRPRRQRSNRWGS